MNRDHEPEGPVSGMALGAAALALAACCVLPAVIGSAAVGAVLGAAAHALGANALLALSVCVAAGGLMFVVRRLKSSKGRMKDAHDPEDHGDALPRLRGQG